MKRLVQILMTITTISSLGILTETKNAVACYANPLPSIKVGDSMAKVLQDLLDNGGCGERLTMMKYDERTILVCSAIGGIEPPLALKVLVRDGVVRQVRRTKFDESSYYLCDF